MALFIVKFAIAYLVLLFCFSFFYLIGDASIILLSKTIRVQISLELLYTAILLSMSL